MINQLKGLYEVKSPNIKEVHHIATQLLNDLRKNGHTINLEHMLRGNNSIADKLASDAALRGKN